MRFIILYVALGYAVLSWVVLFHMLRAEIKGYNACEWWELFMPSILETFSVKELAIWFLWITITWPMRVVQLKNELADLYDLYKERPNVGRVSR